MLSCCAADVRRRNGGRRPIWLLLLCSVTPVTDMASICHTLMAPHSLWHQIQCACMDSPLGAPGDLWAVSWSSFALRYGFAFTGVLDAPKFVLLQLKAVFIHLKVSLQAVHINYTQPCHSGQATLAANESRGGETPLTLDCHKQPSELQHHAYCKARASRRYNTS
jgi:hypothetical protein